jgi:hypothetical protein
MVMKCGARKLERAKESFLLDGPCPKIHRSATASLVAEA